MNKASATVTAAGAERDRIYGVLLKEIVEGILPAGHRLIELQLTARLGVSRTPLREALFRLEHEGFVVSALNRGFSVKPLDDSEARDLYPILAALEALAITLAGPLIRVDLDSLRQINARLAAARGRPRTAIEADTAFHQMLVRRCANLHLVEMIENLRRQLLRYEYVYMGDAKLIDLSVTQHKAILKAIERADLAAAEAAVAEHYNSGLSLVSSKLRRACAATESSGC